MKATTKFQKPKNAEVLFCIAQQIAKTTGDFHKPKGYGLQNGNGATNEFLRTLQEVARNVIGSECQIEERAVPGTQYRFDFYFPGEETVVEIALSLGNANTEFEKDVLKAILAKEAGKKVSRLILIGKKGCVQRQTEPGPMAVRKFARQRFGLQVDVWELI